MASAELASSLSSPIIIRVTFFLLFGFDREPKKKKGKRVPLGQMYIKGMDNRKTQHHYGGGVSVLALVS